MEGGDLPAPTVIHLDRGGRRTSVVATANANANANRSGVGRYRGRGGAFQLEQQPDATWRIAGCVVAENTWKAI